MEPSYKLKDLVLYFLKLGTIGFGGPVALVGYMHSDLVEKRKWIQEEECSGFQGQNSISPTNSIYQRAVCQSDWFV